VINKHFNDVLHWILSHFFRTPPLSSLLQSSDVEQVCDMDDLGIPSDLRHPANYKG
jgi:hypothetical protein